MSNEYIGKLQELLQAYDKVLTDLISVTGITFETKQQLRLRYSMLCTQLKVVINE